MRQARRVERGPYARARAHRDGGLHHDGLEVRRALQRLHHRPQPGQVRVAGRRGRGVHAHVGDLGAVERLGQVEGEGQALLVPGDQVAQARLVDGHVAGAQQRDLLRVDVADDHPVAELGQAGAGHQTDVSGAEHGDVAFRLADHG